MGRKEIQEDGLDALEIRVLLGGLSKDGKAHIGGALAIAHFSITELKPTMEQGRTAAGWGMPAS